MINLFGYGLEGKVNVDWQYVCIPSGCSPDGCEWTWQRTDSKYYYVKDHLGNIRVTLQQNGNLASARDYYPYGETLRAYTTAGVGDRYQFTEKERDTETNLDYFGARYYDGGIIRWLTPDPLADKYYGWSPYNYVLGNPLRYIDPDGRAVAAAPLVAPKAAYLILAGGATVLVAIGAEDMGRGLQDGANWIDTNVNKPIADSISKLWGSITGRNTEVLIDQGIAQVYIGNAQHELYRNLQ
jgi:RHS repeat-associated protein